ncbi:MAG: ABC transporter permease [Chloroflexi bacterium]|nr:ABC transporter permease [Chloroflexota bacterium]
MKKSIWKDTKLSGLVLIVLLCILWELSYVTNLVNSMSWPSLSSVVRSFVQLLINGEIISNVIPSLQRLAFGYIIAVILGVVIGLFMGYFREVFNLLEPLTEILRPIPSPAYIPVVILFLGIDDEMKVFMIVFASFFPILLNTYSGVRAVDPVQVNTARTFGLSSWKIVRQIVIPAASPYIITGMRISLAISLILVVISEMVAANSGIGFFILNAQRSFRVKEMYAGIIALAIIGYSLNSLFLAFERKLMAWHIGATKKEAV